MSVFKTAAFESNFVADATCSDFFSKKQKKKKGQIKSNGFINSDKVTKKRNKTKLKETLQNKREVIKKVVKSIKKNGLSNTVKLVTNKFSSNKTSSENKSLIGNKSNKKKIKKQKIKLKEDKIKRVETPNEENELLRHEIQGLLNGTISEEALKVKKSKPIDKLTRAIQKKPIAEKPPVPLISKNKRKKLNTVHDDSLKQSLIPNKVPTKSKKKEKLENLLLAETVSKVEKKPKAKRHLQKSLRERMLERLSSAQFRYINEQIYSNDSKSAQRLFQTDPGAFEAYHEGYRQQVDKWPLNPVDTMIKMIKKMPTSFIIVDFGCGDAKIAKTLTHKVHSFDLVAGNELVVACDMARCPLDSNSVDVAVFCLSLMGTNLNEYLIEANRVLKTGGILKIAEVESRFNDVNEFIEGVKHFNFKLTWKDLSHNLFYFLDFKKESNIKNKNKLPTLGLHPCLYKKR